MLAIRIEVVRSRQYRATDGFHVYSDRGTGTMNWVHPETARRVMFWEDAPGAARHQLGGHLMGPHLDGIRPDGYLEGTHLLDQQAYPAALVTYQTDAVVFGRFRHAVVTQDAAGNALTAGVIIRETVVNSAPPPAGRFRPTAHDAENHWLEFSFVAGPRLIG